MKAELKDESGVVSYRINSYSREMNSLTLLPDMQETQFELITNTQVSKDEGKEDGKGTVSQQSLAVVKSSIQSTFRQKSNFRKIRRGPVQRYKMMPKVIPEEFAITGKTLEKKIQVIKSKPTEPLSITSQEQRFQQMMTRTAQLSNYCKKFELLESSRSSRGINQFSVAQGSIETPLELKPRHEKSKFFEDKSRHNDIDQLIGSPSDQSQDGQGYLSHLKQGQHHISNAEMSNAQDINPKQIFKNQSTPMDEKQEYNEVRHSETVKTEYLLNLHSSRAYQANQIQNYNLDLTADMKNGQIMIDKNSARSSTGCQANERDFEVSNDPIGQLNLTKKRIKRVDNSSIINEDILKEQFKILQRQLLSLNHYTLSNKRSRSMTTSFDWSHVNIEDMGHYERALKIANIKAERTLGYSKLSNAKRMKRENFRLDKGKQAEYPSFQDIQRMSQKEYETEQRNKHIKIDDKMNVQSSNENSKAQLKVAYKNISSKQIFLNLQENGELMTSFNVSKTSKEQKKVQINSYRSANSTVIYNIVSPPTQKKRRNSISFHKINNIFKETYYNTQQQIKRQQLKFSQKMKYLRNREKDHKSSQKILQTRYDKDKTVLVNKDLKFDKSIKENLKVSYTDARKSATLENDIFKYVDKKQPKPKFIVHKAPIRPESVNRIIYPEIYFGEKKENKIVKRSQSVKNYGIMHVQRMFENNLLQLTGQQMELNTKVDPQQLIEEIKSFDQLIQYQINNQPQSPPTLKTILENETSHMLDQTSPHFIEDGAKYQMDTFLIQNKMEQSVSTNLDLESPLNLRKCGLLSNNSPGRSSSGRVKPHLIRNYDFVRDINITSQQNKDLINICSSNNLFIKPQVIFHSFQTLKKSKPKKQQQKVIQKTKTPKIVSRIPQSLHMTAFDKIVNKIDPKKVEKDLNSMKRDFKVRTIKKNELLNLKPDFKLNTKRETPQQKSQDKVFFNPIESQNSILTPLANLDEFMKQDSEKFYNVMIKEKEFGDEEKPRLKSTLRNSDHLIKDIKKKFQSDLQFGVLEQNNQDLFANMTSSTNVSQKNLSIQNEEMKWSTQKFVSSFHYNQINNQVLKSQDNDLFGGYKKQTLGLRKSLPKKPQVFEQAPKPFISALSYNKISNGDQPSISTSRKPIAHRRILSSKHQAQKVIEELQQKGQKIEQTFFKPQPHIIQSTILIKSQKSPNSAIVTARKNGDFSPYELQVVTARGNHDLQGSQVSNATKYDEQSPELKLKQMFTGRSKQTDFRLIISDTD